MAFALTEGDGSQNGFPFYHQGTLDTFGLVSDIKCSKYMPSGSYSLWQSFRRELILDIPKQFYSNMICLTQIYSYISASEVSFTGWFLFFLFKEKENLNHKWGFIEI